MSPSDELRAAAKLIASKPAIANQYDDAACKIALAYLAEHSDDDCEPVTEEWLVAVGAEMLDSENDDRLFGWYDVDSGELRLQLENCDGVWMASFADEYPWPDDIYVREQVRRLCDALWIELKETQ